MKDAPVQIRSDHNTGGYVPYSYRIVSGFFNVPYYLISKKGYETGPPVYSPYPRRLESLTICGCNHKGSTFSSVILRPLVRPELNSRPSACQPNVQPTEPPVGVPKTRVMLIISPLEMIGIKIWEALLSWHANVLFLVAVRVSKTRVVKTRVMLKFGRGARRHFVTLIKIAVHLITCISGHT